MAKKCIDFPISRKKIDVHEKKQLPLSHPLSLSKYNELLDYTSAITLYSHPLSMTVQILFAIHITKLLATL